MNDTSNTPISAEGYAGLLIVQNHLLHGLVHDIIATVQATDPTVQVTRALTEARERAAVLYAETDAGRSGMPDFGPLAVLFDADAGWRLKRSLEIALIDAARKHLGQHIPALRTIEVDLERYVDEDGHRSYDIEYAQAKFTDGRWMSFSRDTQTNSGPFSLVLDDSSALTNTDHVLEDKVVVDAHAAMLGCEATLDAINGRVASLSEYLRIYYSHTRLEPGIDTIFDASL